jgi:hypothetical protein
VEAHQLCTSPVVHLYVLRPATLVTLQHKDSSCETLKILLREVLLLHIDYRLEAAAASKNRTYLVMAVIGPGLSMDGV